MAQHNKSLAFDPFCISSDHSEHSQATNIIVLEESGKVFCPLCLEKVSLSNINEVKDELCHQYIYNLFEALDQHSEKHQLRKIVLTLLELILKKRPIPPKSDYEFHNILRIIHKLINDDYFKLNEFSSITKIISAICRHFINFNPIPLHSFWKTTKSLIDYAKNRLDKTFKTSSDTELCEFYGGLAILVKTYLEILERFSLDQVSEFIFPLYHDSSLLPHDWRYYYDTQRTCIIFLEELWLEYCWPYFTAGHERVLSDHELKLVAEVYRALERGLTSSTRIKHTKLHILIIEKDLLKISHELISKNGNQELRMSIRHFLKIFTIHHIKEKFGSDREFLKLFEEGNPVELNYRNVLSYSKNSLLDQYHPKIVFYFLINCVGMQQSSKYFCERKVKKVLKCVDPDLLHLRKSRVLMKAYLHLCSKLIPRPGLLDNVENFVVKSWQEKEVDLNEEFCFDDAVFCWVHDHPDFLKQVNVQTLSYVLNKQMENVRLVDITEKLLKSKRYKRMLTIYLRDDESALKYVEEMSKTKTGLYLFNQLSAIIPAVFQHSLLRALNGIDNSQYLERVEKSVIMVTTMVRNCQHFNLILDDEIIQDLFQLMESLYQKISDKVESVLVHLNRCVSSVIETNNSHVMKILYHLDRRVLGYMFSCLVDQNFRIKLVESIASVIISCSNLDYPLRHDIDKSLVAIADESSNWMLSKDRNLNILALKLTYDVCCKSETERSIKIYHTTGLLHRLFINSGIVDEYLYQKLFFEMLKLDELKYHPLLNKIMANLPTKVRININKILGEVGEVNIRSDSPVMSFDTDESSNFGEDQIDIANILSQLHEEDVNNRLDNSCRIPDSLFVTSAIQDQHSSLIDTVEWEQTAFQSTQKADAA